jgi:hypothetical protein
MADAFDPLKLRKGAAVWFRDFRHPVRRPRQGLVSDVIAVEESEYHSGTVCVQAPEGDFDVPGRYVYPDAATAFDAAADYLFEDVDRRRE